VRRELGLALVQRERLLERICLGVYALIDAKLIAKLRRATFRTWLACRLPSSGSPSSRSTA